jgi:putative ATP-dependent endonuclease of OLD family
MKILGVNKRMKERMRRWASNIDDLDVELFIRDIDSVGKGRFAQRLASIILGSGTKKCPGYVRNSVKFVAEKCRPS